MSGKRTLIGTPLPLRTRVLLGVVPVVTIVVLYSYFSHQRHVENPKDWALPNLTQLAEGFTDVTTVDKRKGVVALVTDTSASLGLLGKGLGLGVLFASVVGLSIGIFSTVRGLLSPITIALAKVPPITLIPIFFLAFGSGDESKIAIIVAGIAPTMANGIALIAQAIPRNVIVKAYTLGASTPEVAIKVILPQVLPQMVDSLRLTIGPAWVYLIASEYLVAEAGLGYRISLSARFLRMDITLLYIFWVTLIGVGMDYGLTALSRWIAPWASTRKED